MPFLLAMGGLLDEGRRTNAAWTSRRWLLALGAIVVLAAVATALSLTAGRGAVHQGRRVGDWLADLANPDYRVSAQAQRALAGLGPEAAPELARALRAHDSRLRDLWQRTLGHFVSRPMRAIPAARLRQQAALVLGRLGPQAHSVAPGLVAALGDEEAEVCRAAQWALWRIGPGAVGPLVEGLRDSRWKVRQGAAEALGSLHELGYPVTRAVGPLTGALRDRRAEVRAAAAAALGAVGVAKPPVVAELAGALGDPDGGVRIAAAKAVGGFGEEARRIRPALAACLMAADPRLRVEASRALWRVEGRAEGLVPVLTRALRDPQVHWQAALALGEIGPAADAAVPALLAALETEVTYRPSRTPASAALALARMSAAAVPGLIALLENERPAVRVGAALALAGHRARAAAAVPRLVAMLGEADSEARIVATNTLGAIGQAAGEALPQLRRLTQESDEYLRAAAWLAIAQITGPRDPVPAATTAHTD